ncbi:hypothetical protein [Nitrospirillum iridis]|uniref:Uncharacterized protein n=1 Tax=Nitrospirillum iridis TaxID=765888 RepID=A0A7X0AVE4_9PROT|nr:hypothetical protein [Nitrospirillum iridis]MBB6250823.1 hypothetical protein [Nitrospirillum iridis]
MATDGHSGVPMASQRMAAILFALVDALRPCRIYLLAPFPPCADSAVGHFLIVIDDEAPTPCWDANLALSTLGRLGVAAAVSVQCMGDFRSTLQVEGTIAQRMVEEGELLFAARSPPAPSRQQFQNVVRRS